MSVQDTSHGIRYGFIMIPAFDQNRKKPGDRSVASARAGALEKLRQLGEDCRGIAFARRRFARGQPDFPLSHGKSGDAVDHAEDVLAFVPEVFRDRQS